MAIVSFGNLIRHAALHRYALNIVPIDSLAALETAFAAAQAQRAPLVLAPVTAPRAPGMAKALFAACEAAGREADIPVVLMGLKSTAKEGLTTAINRGCSAVCVQPSTTDFPQVVAEVKALAEIGKSCRIAIGSVLPDHPASEAAQDNRPAAAECIALAQRTALDFLEVDIGGGEAGKRRTKLDYGRLRRIHEGAPIPLMTCIAGEVQSDQVHRLIESGLTLVHHVDAGVLAETFKLWGGAGRAAEVLAQCPPLEPVVHVVEFNASADALPELDHILRAGRQRLAAIPGVRRVATGEAVTDQARYRHCWLVTFANEHIIDYYRHHPVHVAFADQLFRPIAEDRLTIDFRLTDA
jgi:fructose-bisphosphate aldolase class II